MNFTSFHFVGFFFVTLLLGHLLRNRAQRIFLLLASYYFYGAFEPYYLTLILISSALDYVAARGIFGARQMSEGATVPRFEEILAVIPSRVYLWLSIVLNLGLLGYFKYTNFGIEILNDVQPYGNTIFAWPAADILLPIGISFYTFQSMSYTIDVYRGTLEPRRQIIDFLLYVAFFPQLVAGPIVRAPVFFRDLDSPRRIMHEDVVVGVTRIVVGFFRKIVLADNAGVLVNIIFATAGERHPLDIWLGALLFGFQVYFDFAGYTDIARGVARLFGFEFDVNFAYPMAARNIQEHWRRWHLSLTTWIRDYVYLPLGGSRVSVPRFYVNMFIVWFLTAVWHGPAYHYVGWGIVQYVMIVAHRFYSQSPTAETLRRSGIVYEVVARVPMWAGLALGYIYFRADTMELAHLMIGRSFGIFDLNAVCSQLYAFAFSGGGWAAVSAAWSGPELFAPSPGYGWYWLLLAFMLAYDLVFDRLHLEYFWQPRNRGKLALILALMTFCVLTLGPPVSPNFIYFQF